MAGVEADDGADLDEPVGRRQVGDARHGAGGAVVAAVRGVRAGDGVEVAPQAPYQDGGPDDLVGRAPKRSSTRSRLPRLVLICGSKSPVPMKVPALSWDNRPEMESVSPAPTVTVSSSSTGTAPRAGADS
ncbi:hypothetical protein ACFYWP_23775 [Actinacidiphila glaucinigra]|uniref:hypothetical protein n=1 Tax=Actinacidiphila glaucinigra TaxID=235986 RepID=UPI0036C69DFD